MTSWVWIAAAFLIILWVVETVVLVLSYRTTRDGNAGTTEAKSQG